MDLSDGVPRSALHDLYAGSPVLWHFTGRQSDHDRACSNLISILRCGLLKATSDEIYKLQNVTTEAVAVLKGPAGDPPIGCLSDIPPACFPFHAERFGNFAIGFHRQRALDAGFRRRLYLAATNALPLQQLRSIVDKADLDDATRRTLREYLGLGKTVFVHEYDQHCAERELCTSVDFRFDVGNDVARVLVARPEDRVSLLEEIPALESRVELFHSYVRREFATLRDDLDRYLGSH